MKATKVKVTIEVEVLAIESAPALIANVAEQISLETEEGTLIKDDGDTVTWGVERTKVAF